MPTTTTPEQQFHSDFSKNVKILESARKKLNSQINHFLRKNDDYSLRIYTNLYLLNYNAWTEAALIKLIHTPFGFSNSEKQQILKKKNVINKWKACINTAFSKFDNKPGSEIPNKKREINMFLDDYLKNQAQIRNKIAHGQWIYPLFSHNRAHDPDAKVLIDSIDVIQIDTWFKLFDEFIEIVRGLIDARKKNNHLAHYIEYYTRLSKIKTIIKERKKWTVETKRQMVNLKPIPNSKKS